MLIFEQQNSLEPLKKIKFSTVIRASFQRNFCEFSKFDIIDVLKAFLQIYRQLRFGRRFDVCSESACIHVPLIYMYRPFLHHRGGTRIPPPSRRASLSCPANFRTAVALGSVDFCPPRTGERSDSLAVRCS